MNNSNLFINNNIQSKNLKKSLTKKLNNNFKKIFLEIKNDIENSKKTLNVLDKKFKFNFEIKDLKRFKKFKTVAIIGMGGSILGSEARYNFLQNKIKKKFYFLIILMKTK